MEQKEIIKVEMTNEEKTEIMLAIAREEGGRTQYMMHGTAPAALAILPQMIAHTVVAATEDFDMPDFIKKEFLERVIKSARKALDAELNGGVKTEAVKKEGEKKESEDDEATSDLEGLHKALDELLDLLRGVK